MTPVPINTNMTVAEVMEHAVESYLDNGTNYAHFQVALEAAKTDADPKKKILVHVEITLTEMAEWPTSLLSSTGGPDQPRMQDLERKP